METEQRDKYTVKEPRSNAAAFVEKYACNENSSECDTEKGANVNGNRLLQSLPQCSPVIFLFNRCCCCCSISLLHQSSLDCIYMVLQIMHWMLMMLLIVRLDGLVVAMEFRAHLWIVQMKGASSAQDKVTLSVKKQCIGNVCADLFPAIVLDV